MAGGEGCWTSHYSIRGSLFLGPRKRNNRGPLEDDLDRCGKSNGLRVLTSDKEAANKNCSANEGVVGKLLGMGRERMKTGQGAGCVLEAEAGSAPSLLFLDSAPYERHPVMIVEVIINLTHPMR